MCKYMPSLNKIFGNFIFWRVILWFQRCVCLYLFFIYWVLELLHAKTGFIWYILMMLSFSLNSLSFYNYVFVTNVPIIKILLLLILSNQLCADHFFIVDMRSQFQFIFIFILHIREKIVYVTIILYIYSSTFITSFTFKNCCLESFY